MKNRAAWRAGAALAPLVIAACGQVLGIEDAYVDPTLLSTGGTESQSGASGSGTGGAFTFGGSPTTSGGQNSAGNEATSGSTSVEAGAGGEGGGGGEDDSLCERYCTAINEYCTGTLAQYRDHEQCMAVCRLFPEGSLTAADGNTVSCRLKYADKARYAGGTELAAYCRQSGPGGSNGCGSNCDGFCTIMMATCATGETDPYYYPSLAACMNDCRSVPAGDYSYGEVADGNTYECRMFHVTSAVMMDPEEHCAHAMGVTLCEETP